MSSSTTAGTGSTPQSNPSTDQSSQTSGPQSTGARGKTDLAWAHCREASELSVGCKKIKLACLYYGKTFAGGGINRFKKHLAASQGDVEKCNKCPADVRHQMILSFQGNVEKRKRAREMRDDFNPFNVEQREQEEMMYRQNGDGGEDEDEGEIGVDLQHNVPPQREAKRGSGSRANQTRSTMTTKQPTSSGRKDKKKAIVGAYFMPRTTHGAQKSLKHCWQNKEAIQRCDLTIVKWMIDACIPFNAVNSLYYQHAIDVITSTSPGYKGPNYYDVRGFYLTKVVDEVKSYVASYREIWKKTGCTLMADGWSDQKRRTLINFTVYCPKGTVFLKSVDASDASKTVEMLHKMFREVVLFVGPKNIVHMVVNNAANYVVVGRLLMAEFKTIFWSPCVAHCINLILHFLAVEGQLVLVLLPPKTLDH